ncbi:kynureninase [Plakobranchus ocellatus]|uniref:Kynureninase n=1 Tax=Plakobranchus ocellatus TaxID=259542 RepID=A0AAV4CZP6_9GAST|nr:kynureninase [Plakobranchus ocellatus]
MRPNASLHHHSTVVTLKQTRCGGMYSWLKHLPAPVRRLLWQKARKGGKELRDKHRARDLATQRECHRLSQQQPQNPKNARDQGSSKVPSSLALPNANECLSKDDWVAVAYPQTWYIGLVLRESAAGAAVLVDFGEPSKGLGCFKYPDGRDTQEVERCFILKTKVSVSPAPNLRYWITDNSKEIEQLDRQYTKCDKRLPRVIRIAPAPLYCSFLDVHRFMTCLRDALVAAKNSLVHIDTQQV